MLKKKRNFKFLLVNLILTTLLFFFSVSTQANELLYKFKSPSFSGINSSSHYLTIENQEATRRAAIKEEPGQIFIKEFPPSTVTPGQIQAYIKKFGDQGIKLDAIVIDYLNLIHSTVGTNSYERIKNVTEKCRAMSYLFNCPIISATQLNRAGFDQDNPDLATISESIGLLMMLI